METIHVPGPPKQAFNKNRRISDLIRAQVNHLKHVEASMPAEQRSGIPQHEITTESDAANYIAAMTNLFQAKGAAAPVRPATPVIAMTPATPVAPVPIQPAPPVSAAPGLAIAATADASPKKIKSKKDKQKKKDKSAAKTKKREKK